MRVLDSGVSAHLPPGPDGGFGVPYYGRVTKIEDRYGNRVEYEYCDFEYRSCDAFHTPDCRECCPTCNQKDQIRRIRLFAAGESNPAWTLLYCHRGFGTFHTYFLFTTESYTPAEYDTMVADFADGEIAPDNALRGAFSSNGYALSAGVAVEPLTDQYDWLITDGDREYVLAHNEEPGDEPHTFTVRERWGL